MNKLKKLAKVGRGPVPLNTPLKLVCMLPILLSQGSNFIHIRIVSHNRCQQRQVL